MELSDSATVSSVVERGCDVVRNESQRLGKLEFETISRQALKLDVIDPSVLELRWDGAPQKDELFDQTIDLIFRRVLQTLVGENDFDIEATAPSIFATMDIFFYARWYRKEPESWSLSFYDLLIDAMDLLVTPERLLVFWQYPESRINWFVMNTSMEELPEGCSKMVSYKPPLFDKLRTLNEMLRKLQSSITISTPSLLEWKFKLTKFVSEILPLHEESNFNRSGDIARGWSKISNIWNNVAEESGRESSAVSFHHDLLYVTESLISNPLQIVFTKKYQIREIETCLVTLLDKVLGCEEDFYSEIQKNLIHVKHLNGKLNSTPYVKFDFSTLKEPDYMASLDTLAKSRQQLWSAVSGFYARNRNVVLTDGYEISINNADILYEQFSTTSVDIYRKQFICQLFFSLSLIQKITTDEKYMNHFQNLCERNTEILGEAEVISNENKSYSMLQAFCHRILASRLLKFYKQKDPVFNSILEKSLKYDDALLQTKIDGFKFFQRFKYQLTDIKALDVDMEFGNFGFIKFGNKQLTNVWKIPTGLESIKIVPHSATDTFESLRARKSNTSGDEHKQEKEESDRIVKDWQTLRLLRNEFMFKLSGYNEIDGLSGLFDGHSDPDKKRQHRKDIMEKLSEAVKKPHYDKLSNARNYFASRNEKRRSESKDNADANKKHKNDEGGFTELSKEASRDQKTPQNSTRENSMNDIHSVS